MQYGMPPQAYAQLYTQSITAQQQQQFKTAGNVQHAFEDATQMVTQGQQQQQQQPMLQQMYTQPQPPPQQQQQPQQMYAQQPQYGAGGYASAAAQQTQQQQQYAQPQQMYTQQQQPPQQQQQPIYAQQQQQQQYAQQQQQQQPMRLSGGAPDDILRMSEIQLVADDQRNGLCTHPSVPRLRLDDVAADMVSTPPAPSHITTVTRRTLRLTLDALPASGDLANTLALPIALHVRPFAEPRVAEVNFAEVDNVMIRCQRCQAYITPYTTFTHNGERWICILCRTINSVSGNYRCPLDPRTGLREDVLARPELTHCSVDFFATSEFLRREPARPVLLVLLDCTHHAVASGLLAAMCAGALSALERIVQGNSNNNNDGGEDNNNAQGQDASALHMCVMAYDATVYFFNLRADLSAPQMIAAPDVVHDVRAMNDDFKLDAIELPCPVKELVVSVTESYALLREVFSKLPTLFAQTTQVDSAFGPAVTAALSVLDATGGKVLASVASLPSLGEGKLRHRGDVAIKVAGSSKEHTAYTPVTDWYKQRALVCSNRSVSFDLFVRTASGGGSGGGGNAAAAAASSDVDLATIVPLARYTSGHVYCATTLTMPGITAQLERALTRHIAFESVLRVRTTAGLTVSNCYGHCLVRQPELIALPITDEDACYTLELKVGPYFNAKYAYVQVATIHTTRARERRIRVHTIQIPVAATLTRLLNAVNSIGLACYWTRMAVDEAQRGSLAQARQKVTDALVAALKLARREAQKQQLVLSPGRLYVPTSMRYVPQIVCGFLRSPAVGAPLGGGGSGGGAAVTAASHVSADERVAHMARVTTAPPEAMLAYFVPWWYKIAVPYDHLDHLPAPTYASVRCLLRSGIFLLNLGSAVVLWCGSEANVAVAQALGLQPLPSMLANANEMASYAPEQLAGLRARTDALIWQQRDFDRAAFAAELTLYSDVTQPRLDGELARACVEDAVATLPSYSSFLTMLWKNSMLGA